MRRVSVLSGSAFRTALIILAVFAVVLSVAGFAIVKITQTSITDQLRSSITEDFNLLRDASITGGETELLRFIKAAVATRSDKQYAFGVFKPSGKRIAGDIAVVPSFRGWGMLPAEAGQTASDPQFLGYAETLDDNIVVAARSQRFEQTLGGVILNALILAGVVICVSALTVGYWLSRGVSSKLGIIDRTLAQVSHGNTEARLPIGPSNDQIDHVSRQINAHLDRLGELMSGMRNTIVAIAHDLKSPLNRAYMLLQDAAGEAEPAAASAKLERAQSEMETLGGVLDTVLRISRIGTSDDSSGYTAFSSALLVRDLAQTFDPVIEAAGQRLRWDAVPEDGAPIFGDRKMVQQMLVNLIENASRYGGPSAAIELAVRSDNGGAVITVTDNGPGIPADKREEVFEPFRRLDAERAGPGAGLGLALVKAVAVRHHARVSLGDNKPGLRVTVSFPPMRRPVDWPERREAADLWPAPQRSSAAITK
ncbi:MAG: HAMP domain-containing sensor histidine kinase [Devosia sp.]